MANISWKRGISGQFNDAQDWSSNSVPTPNDNVAIDARGTYTVTVSANETIRSLTTISTATLAITGGHRLTVTNGTTGTGASAGTISIADSGALETGGTFQNTGRINLNSTGHATDFVIASNTLLTGDGVVQLSDNSHNVIEGLPSRFPFPFFSFLFATTLTNVSNTIEGSGTIGPNLVLDNEAKIIGNGVNAGLILNTGFHTITNSGVIEGTSAQGVTIVSNVTNTGLLEAFGPDASLTIDGAVNNTTRLVFPITRHTGIVEAAGDGAHVNLSSATINGGTLSLGAGSIAETVADSGQSSLSNLAVTGSGTVEANSLSTLSINNSTISTTSTLMSNGLGSAVIVNGNVGAVSTTIDGGDVEFGGSSAANVDFTAGAAGILTLDSTFSGTVSGFAGQAPTSFSNMFVFGDSSVDVGALQFLSPDLGDPNLTARLQNALANGGTDSPVGVGEMNVQYLAAMFGLTLSTAYTTDGVVGGGGTDYAISGALDAADMGGGSDIGNGGLTNSFQESTGVINPAVLSTVDQVQAYLNSTGGVADSSALYIISSGANDSAYVRSLSSSEQVQDDYLAPQAQTLANEIIALFDAGARHIIVNDVGNNANASSDYSRYLYDDLDAAGVSYIKSDVHEMSQTVQDNPGNYGFTSTTVSTNDPALIEPDSNSSDGDQKGYGLWGADTTSQESSTVPLIDQYSYLQQPDNPQQPISPEETNFFADDQHFSDAGQRIEASFEYNLVADDAIDLTNLTYDPAHTTVSFSGTTTGGTLTVSNGVDSVNIALLGNYTAAAFTTASDGAIAADHTTGTLVLDTGGNPQLLLATAPH